MRATPFPDICTLADGLANALTSGGARAPVPVLERKANPQAGTFASEIVTCRLVDGTERRLFCKYGPTRHHSPDGRPGLAYEALVHRQVLRPARAATPELFGVYAHAPSDSVWLFFNHLEGAVHASRAPSQGTALELAAGWIGQFHAAHEATAARADIALTRYDRAWYLRWPRRTHQLAGDLRERYPWLTAACDAFEGCVDQLLAQPLTVIHADYYTDNVLYRDGAVYPIDWEWAALAPGEIDLASLVSRWPADLVERCVRSYCDARWPDGPPADFQRTLDVAKLYLCFRYMGISREFMMSERRRWRFEAVRLLSEKLGLL